MSDKIQKAFENLIDTISEEAGEGLDRIKQVAKPIMGHISTIVAVTELASKIGGLENIFKSPTESATPTAPLPTPAQSDAINALKAVGKTEEEIATILNLNILTVKMAA